MNIEPLREFAKQRGADAITEQVWDDEGGRWLELVSIFRSEPLPDDRFYVSALSISAEQAVSPHLWPLVFDLLDMTHERRMARA